MKTQFESSVESVAMDSQMSGAELATWDRPRSAEQLLSFLTRREAEIFATDR